MLAAAITIIVLAPRCPYKPDLKWYNKDPGYKIYVQSFKDSDGDGVGDLNGLKSKIDYLVGLGVKSIWLNSIFKSDNVDGSNGVVDYKDIDPQLGTIEDLQSLTKAMFNKDLHLILDFIPNHTSRNHTWFQKSQRGEIGFEDYYVWADKDNGWKNDGGGSLWQLDTVRNKYYLHQTATEFPDLNLKNEAVQKEMTEILKFWVSKGVYGFHVVGTQYLTENANFSTQNGKDEYINYKDNLEVISQWRGVLDSLSNKPGREKVLMTSLPATLDKNTTMNYFGDGEQKGFHMVASRVFAELDQTCDALCLDRKIEQEGGDISQWRGWVFGDEETARPATRFPGKLGRLMRTVQMFLQGTSFIYYGDELPMEDGENSASPPIDVYRSTTGGTIRDIFRTPMQWDTTENAGFTEGTPYIPLSADYQTNNVKVTHEFVSTFSFLDLVRDLIALRTNESIQFGGLQSQVEDNVLFVYTKAEGFPAYLLVANFDSMKHSVPLYAGEGAMAPKLVSSAFSTEEKASGKIINVDGKLVTINAQTARVFKFIE
ncbi:hypothetical protein LOTGIDRAFT_119072 [Lottia gigantea]|uniref:Glycosyl hydrolase family 13 catalytic domain-containing protein n=1 Tax=Lottia gigantea TaxID=225164 RepID=V3ZQF9_LOTGI|nr:hypothetical protein LOTGIDRAFT_119072 [Lottia gigantea]ESO93633.1 hypothetical protein LOTGIDRAFT_119072 [Lottia gigantea]